MTEPTDGERAAFEAGVKFGTLYHQFAGTPVSPASAGSLARAMEDAIENQPFCTNVSVQVDEDRLLEAIGPPAGSANETADGSDDPPGTGDESSTDATAHGDESSADATAEADYVELTGTLFDATIEVERAGHAVTARMETERDYPLMWLEAVRRPDD